MAVGKTQFSIGFKSAPVRGMERLRQSLLASLTAEMLIGPVSPLYQRLLEEGLINDTLDTDCFSGEGWFTVLVEGESDDPEEVLARLQAEIARVQKEGIDAERFAALQRAAYGDALLSVNTPAAASSAMLDACMMRLDSPYAERSCLAALTPADALTLLRERLNPEQVCLSVITPMQDREPDTKG
jgi:predicted Zn-dependent peptidase